MNKKFIRVISLILSVMMIFACAVTASADDSTTAAEKIKVTIRVEGVKKNLAKEEINVEKLSTVKDAIDAAKLDVVYAEDGTTITSVKGEETVKTSKWQYAVNNVIVKDKVNACVLKENAEIILYNATEDAVIPLVNAEDAATGGVVTFYSKDKDGKEIGISGATIKWEKGKNLLGISEFAEYTTDSKGRILISDATQLGSGDHAVEITKTNAYDVPEIVRMENFKAVVPSLDAVEGGETKTLFEEIYDFLYSILKGVLEVWSFYLNAIVGILGGGPLFGAVGTAPVL